MQLWQRQAISLEQLLQSGNFPFADELLQSIQSQKERLAAGKCPSVDGAAAAGREYGCRGVFAGCDESNDR